MDAVVSFFDRVIIRRPLAVLMLVTVISGVFAWYAQDFQLDASADSLLLETDEELRYYRGVIARYGSQDYVVITYTVPDDIIQDDVLSNIGALRDELAKLDNVAQVLTILDVPLISSPPMTLTELQERVPDLEDPLVDRDLARIELTESPLYRDLLMSRDGRTTAILLLFDVDPRLRELLDERDVLREKEAFVELLPDEAKDMERLNTEIKRLRLTEMEAQQANIAEIRRVMDRYRDSAELYLGGLPMIVTDMISYIRSDVLIFGLGILAFLVMMLTLIFRRPRWVIIAMLCCMISVAIMTGWLGLIQWRVTVVSANFVALLLIFSLSLTVHLIVRYRELHAASPDADQRTLLLGTMRDKFAPCLFTSITTMVGFASLLASGIRPVIDFGWMMVVGMIVITLVAFAVFPAGLALLTPGDPAERRDFTGPITAFFSRLVRNHPAAIVVLFALAAIISVTGISRLQVENRFVDYFKESTEIHQGMVAIDQRLGGTTPLDIVLDADPSFFAEPEATVTAGDDEFGDEFDDEFGDEFDDEFGDEFGDEFETDAADEGDLGATSYWYNTFQLGRVAEVHRYLESLPETGKVLSMSTALDTLQTLNADEVPGTFFLSLLYKKLPEDVKGALIDPYLAPDGNQVRLSVRVYETDKNLRRGELLERIENHLVNELGFPADQVRVTGMLVLYNNVLQSLFRSQIDTIGVVFLAITAMFWLLFRSLKIAVIAIVPSMLVAGTILGLMGLAGIPLDIMTITIAAISIGIGVDDAIHYVHRFREELRVDGDYAAAIDRCHASIGRAIYYTSVIIFAGFSILALSNFIPTILFGLFTGLAMIVALIANLTLLPLLLKWLKAT